jgi:hypothetical protein
MTDQLPIIRETRAINASATTSTSLLGRGLAAIQSGKMGAPAELDEEKLFSVLCRLMNAVFKMGHPTFKENARYVIDKIRERYGKSANLITIEHLQGGYIGMKKGTDSKNELIKINSIEELYFDGEPLQFDPEIYKAGVIVGGAYIEAGVKNYTEYTQTMITEFGQAIQPYLHSIYEGVRSYPGFDSSGMDDYQLIESSIILSKAEVMKASQVVLRRFREKQNSTTTQKPNSQPTSENKNNETNKPPNQHD